MTQRLHRYAEHRLAASRAFIHVVGDPDDDLARYALSQGFDMRLLERYEGEAWVRDNLYSVVTQALAYFRQVSTPITSEALVERATRQVEPSATSAVGSAIGEIAGYPRPDKATFMEALRNLVGIRAYGEFSVANAATVEALASVGEDPIKPLKTLISKLRATTQWVQGLDARSGEAYHDLSTAIPELVSEPPYGSDKPPIYTGFANADKMARGFRAGDLVCISGSANAGKTWVLNHIAYHAARHGHLAVYASAEMEWERNAYRLAGTLTGRDYRMYDSHTTSSHVRAFYANSLTEAIEENMPGEIAMVGPAHCPTTDDIREVLWDISRERTPGVLLLDYLTMIRPSVSYGNATDWSVIGETLRELKLLGIEFGIPVIIAAQCKLDSWKRSASKENLMFGAGVISQTIDAGAELRHLNSEFDRLAAEVTGTQLPVERDMKLCWYKMRGCPALFESAFAMDFSNGRVKNLSGFDDTQGNTVDDLVTSFGLDDVSMDGMESV